MPAKICSENFWGKFMHLFLKMGGGVLHKMHRALWDGMTQSQALFPPKKGTTMNPKRRKGPTATSPMSATHGPMALLPIVAPPKCSLQFGIQWADSCSQWLWMRFGYAGERGKSRTTRCLLQTALKLRWRMGCARKQRLGNPQK